MTLTSLETNRQSEYIGFGCFGTGIRIPSSVQLSNSSGFRVYNVLVIEVFGWLKLVWHNPKPYGAFSNITGILLGGPHIKDHRILGSRLGPLDFGKLP